MSLIHEIDYGTPRSKAEAMVSLTIDGNQVTVPAGGLLMTAEGGRATLALRRFAVTFPKDPAARLAPGGSSVLRPPSIL